MLTLNDGRSELWQWDTGRTLDVDADCSQVHFSNKVFGRSIDVDVIDGVAIIPDILLQTDKELNVWAFVGTAENGYTKISKVFKVNKRNKPADYVFTPTEQTTLDGIKERLDRIEESQDPDAIKNAVDEYLADNPIQIEEEDPTVPGWAKQPAKPKYTAKEVGAVATVNGIAPDGNGNVQIEIPEASQPDMSGYATERYVQENYQPKGNYLTEVPAGYAKYEDIPKKPSDIGAQPAGNYALASQIPSVPVQSVNGKTGAVQLSAADVGARPSNWMPTAQDVGALPATYTPPNQTAEQVGADPKGTAAATVAGHNTSTDAHGDIRQELQALAARINAFFDSDDQALDELSEIVAYITSNKGLIDAITTSKVSVIDIVNNLTTNVANKPLSAAQGVVLKGLIDTLTSNLSNYALKSAIPTKVSQLQNDSKYLTQHQDISHLLPRTELPTAIDTALAQAKASGEFDGTSVTVKSVSESTEPGGSNVVTFSDGKTLTVKNGKDGYTPVPGVDYNTPADQEAIVQQVITEIGAETIPDYVVTEAMSVLDKVISAQGNRTFVLGAITDMHYGSSDYIDGVIHACQGMHHIAKRIKLDALGVLGDYTDEWQMDNDAAVTDNEEMNALLDRFNDTVNLRVKGNHDHRPGADAQTYRYIMAYSDDVVWGSRLGGYFYRDFPAYKLRIICLNTTEVSRDNVAVSDEQYNFFVNALDMSTKEDSAEWGILILSHHPLDWTVTSGAYRFGHILNAYQNGNSWTDGTVSCNYTDKNTAIIVGNIHGHIHNLLTDKIYVGEPGNSAQTSVWRMCVPASRVDYPNHYSGIWAEDTTYSKTPNSAKDTAFNIICIDLDAYTIKAFCYGAGYDRTIEYKSVPDNPGGGGDVSDDKNWIKKSTESDGVTPYNGGQGYKTGTRYSASSGAETTSSGCVSGYIPVDYDDTVYLKNVSLNSSGKTNENNIVFVPASGETPWNHPVDTMLTENDAVLDSDGNVTQFSISGTLVSGYIRINAAYIGEDSIVTINEPIE